MAGPRLLLLGPPLVTRSGGEPVRLRRKSLALLAYLAVERRSHSRDLLATLLWPSCGQTRARSNLRLVLHDLGHSIGRPIIVSSQDTLSIDGGEIEIDLDRFRSFARGCGCADGVHCNECLASWEQAEAHFKDGFLVGFSLPDCPELDQWQQIAAERLEGERRELLRRLIAAYEVRSQTVPALKAARRLVELDPLEESAHRLLMRLYAKAGYRAAALRQFRECSRLLDQELQEEPEEATLQLVESIRVGRLAPGGKGAPTLIGPRQHRSAEGPHSVRRPASEGASVARDEIVMVSDVSGPSPRLLAQPVVDCGRDQMHSGLAYAAVYRSVLDALRDAEVLMASTNGGARAVVLVGQTIQIGEIWFGPALARAASLLAVAPPGAPLLTDPAVRRLASETGDSHSVASLGRHRFADLSYPEPLFIPLLGADPPTLPTLRGVDAWPNNLPSQPNSLIGRHREVRELAEALADRAVRVLTITGPAGVGKTRLALHAAAGAISRFEQGAYFVDLSETRGGAARIFQTIRTALGLRDQRRRQGMGKEILVEYLRRRQLLLVLDNFEHLLDAAPEVVSLCDAAPGLTLLFTSREHLGAAGERRYRVKPLGIGPPEGDGENSVTSESFRLFVERGVVARRDIALTPESLEAIATICRQLEGLPLAIELAASRLQALSPLDLAHLLGRRLSVLAGRISGLPHRQQTLARAIDWSFQLLGGAERLLFLQLSVFAGGCTLEAAERVIDGVSIDVVDGIASLVAKNLVRSEEGAASSRFTMFETLRAFASVRFSGTKEASAIHERHADYFLALAEEATPQFHRAHQMQWFDRVDQELENLRAAFRWFIDHGKAGQAMRICVALDWYWYRYGRYTMALEFTGQALAAATGGVGQGLSVETTALKGRAQRVHGWFLHVTGDWALAKQRYLQGLEIAREVNDIESEVRCLSDLGALERWMGDTDSGLDRVSSAIELARLNRQPHLIVRALIWAYSTNGGRALGPAPRARLEEARALAREVGDLWCEAHASNGLGDLYTERGDYDAARREYRAALSGFRALKDDWLEAWTLEGLGRGALFDGRYEDCTEYTRQAIERFAVLGDRANVAILLYRLAASLWHGGEHPLAALLFGACESLRGELSSHHLSRRQLYRSARREAQSTEPQGWEEGRELSYEEALDQVLGRGSALPGPPRENGSPPGG